MRWGQRQARLFGLVGVQVRLQRHQFPKRKGFFSHEAIIREQSPQCNTAPPPPPLGDLQPQISLVPKGARPFKKK